MTKTSKAKLEYMARYEATPANVKKRVERNAARREALKAGTVHKGDGLEVDHKKPLDEGGTNTPGNRRVIPATENRGWRARQPGMYGKKK